MDQKAIVCSIVIVVVVIAALFVYSKSTYCSCTGTNSMPVSTWAYQNKLVPLEAVGASVPPGSVSNNVASYPVNKGYTTIGRNTIPDGSMYAYNYNPDMAVGIM